MGFLEVSKAVYTVKGAGTVCIECHWHTTVAYFSTPSRTVIKLLSYHL
jgi:hypothetical protein